VQRPPKLRAAPAVEFTADGLGDELTAVLLSPVDVSEEVFGQSHSHTFHARYFILQV
jgi:hypothetical protein